MFGWLKKRSPEERAIRSYATKLRRQLRDDYGPHRTYSPGQVRTAAESCGVNTHFLIYAYALYCPRARFAEVASEGQEFGDVRSEISELTGSGVKPRGTEGSGLLLDGSALGDGSSGGSFTGDEGWSWFGGGDGGDGGGLGGDGGGGDFGGDGGGGDF